MTAKTAVAVLLVGLCHALLRPGVVSAREAGIAVAPTLPASMSPELAQQSLREPVVRLIDALKRAYWTNPRLLAERARTRAADFRLPQARSQFGPKLDGQFTYGYERTNTETPLGPYVPRAGWSSTAAAVLTQPVFTFGRNAAAERAALAEVEFANASLRFTEGQVLLDVISAYVGVLRDRAGVAIAEENKALLERELSDNRVRLRLRETTITDVEQVETRSELALAQVLAAKRALGQSEAQFLAVVGGKAGPLEPPNPLTVSARSLAEADAAAEAHNALLAAANAREKISRAQLDAARAERLPRVDFRGRAEVGAVTPFSDDLRQINLSGAVVVSAPLFDGGLRAAQVGEASSLNDADWRLIDNTLRENRAEVANAWNEWKTTQTAIVHFAAAISAARSAYDGALLQERAGFRTALDVIDLARELLLAQSSLNAATAGTYIAQARLLNAMGLLGQGNLFPDDAGYDPTAHFNRVRDNGEIPLLTPLLRKLDSIGTGEVGKRPLRDASAPPHH